MEIFITYFLVWLIGAFAAALTIAFFFDLNDWKDADFMTIASIFLSWIGFLIIALVALLFNLFRLAIFIVDKIKSL